MTLPWERPATGPAAAFAGALAAMIPVIGTARLRLRAPGIGDFPAWAAILCGPRGVHVGGPMDRAAAWAEFTQATATWLLRGHGLWTVEARDGADPLGFVLLGFEPGDREPELGFLFTEAAEGRGHAHEAALAARAHAFGALGWTTVVSYVDPGNRRSARLAERLGAVRDPEAEAAFDEPVLVYRHSPEAGA